MFPLRLGVKVLVQYEHQPQALSFNKWFNFKLKGVLKAGESPQAEASKNKQKNINKEIKPSNLLKCDSTEELCPYLDRICPSIVILLDISIQLFLYSNMKQRNSDKAPFQNHLTSPPNPKKQITKNKNLKEGSQTDTVQAKLKK